MKDISNTEEKNPPIIKDAISRKSYFWTIASVFLALIFGAFAIYTFFYKPTPELTFIVKSKTNVLDINASISNMDILLDSVSLKKQNKNIKIFSIRITNIGSANITTELYDNTVPTSIYIKNGTLLEAPEIISSSSSYIETRIKTDLNIREDKTIVLPNLILDRNEFVDIKFLVLHSNDSIPEINVDGKISGQKRIVITETETKNEITFWDSIIPVSIWVFIVNLIIYGILLLLLIIAIATLVEKISTKRKLSIRKKAVEKFKSSNNVKTSEEFIFNEYIKRGFRAIDSMNHTIQQPEKEITTLYKNGISENANTENNESMYGFYFNGIQKMIDLGVFEVRGENVFIRERAQKTMQKFIDFLMQERLDKLDY